MKNKLKTNCYVGGRRYEVEVEVDDIFYGQNVLPNVVANSSISYEAKQTLKAINRLFQVDPTFKKSSKVVIYGKDLKKFYEQFSVEEIDIIKEFKIFFEIADYVRDLPVIRASSVIGPAASVSNFLNDYRITLKKQYYS